MIEAKVIAHSVAHDDRGNHGTFVICQGLSGTSVSGPSFVLSSVCNKDH